MHFPKVTTYPRHRAGGTLLPYGRLLCDALPPVQVYSIDVITFRYSEEQEENTEESVTL